MAPPISGRLHSPPARIQLRHSGPPGPKGFTCQPRLKPSSSSTEEETEAQTLQGQDIDVICNFRCTGAHSCISPCSPPASCSAQCEDLAWITSSRTRTTYHHLSLQSTHPSIPASVHASVRPSIPASVHASVRPSIPASVHASLSLSIPASMHVSVRPSIPASVHASLSLSIPASVHASLSLSIPASVHASVYQSPIPFLYQC
ncbi:sialidase [Symphalangus syndactylus]|uniref:sialidase n=1 Tax=Symphalangus syndactylus TaxID=9590 RepID=UPI003004486E